MQHSESANLHQGKNLGGGEFSHGEKTLWNTGGGHKPKFHRGDSY